jgi:hypothetical protein
MVMVMVAEAFSRHGREEHTLGSIIAVGFALKWEHPVCVRDGDIQDRLIFGPRAALRYLQVDLTVRSGQTYWNAVAACTSALVYEADPDHARNLFIAAYAEYMVNTDPH